MAPTDDVALRLRFRGPASHDQPPDLSAFVRAPAGPPPSPARTSPIGVHPGGAPLRPHAPLVVFFQYADHGIPDLEIGPLGRPADVSSWSLRPTTFGYLAAVPPRRPGGAARRAAWVVAACLPLVFPAADALAADGPAPAVQQPAKDAADPRPPALDGDDEVTEPTASPEPAPEPEPEPGIDAVKQAPPPAPDPGPDPTLVDAAWEGVDGFDVELELKGRQMMRGRVGAVQRDTFTLIHAKTGAVLVLPKSGVRSLRVRIPPPVPSKTGQGLLIGGGILTAVSAPVFISGLTFLGLCPSCASLHLPMLLIGGGGLAGGIPMIVRGTRLRQTYRKALEEHGVMAMALPTRHGWTGGLSFRF